jgi:hypothetical protein
MREVKEMNLNQSPNSYEGKDCFQWAFVAKKVMAERDLLRLTVHELEAKLDLYVESSTRSKPAMKVITHSGPPYVLVTARTVEPFERAAAGLDLDDDRPRPWILWGQLPTLLATGVCWLLRFR